MKKYYRKGGFLYMETAKYLFEIDFERIEFGIVQFACVSQPVVNWRARAEEIKFVTFKRYYNKCAAVNPLLKSIPIK